MKAKRILNESGNFAVMLGSYILAVFTAGQIISLFITEKVSIADFAIAGFLDLLFVLILFVIARRFILKQDVPEFNISSGQFGQIARVAMLPLLLLGVPTALLFVFDFYTISGVQHSILSFQTWNLVVLTMAALLFQGISSEVLFRGIIFHNLVAWFGPLKATIGFCCVYAALNLLLDGAHLQVFITHGLFSCLLCLIYLNTKNFLATGLFQGVWLITAFLPGVLDEHWREGAPWITEVSGNPLLSGGLLGAEASIFCLLLLVTANVYYFRLLSKQ